VSEVAQGVGDATDIAIIDASRGIWWFEKRVMDELLSIHRAVSSTMTPILDSLKEKVNEHWKMP
jgi:hypothetical protein